MHIQSLNGECQCCVKVCAPVDFFLLIQPICLLCFGLDSSLAAPGSHVADAVFSDNGTSSNATGKLRGKKVE